MKDMGEGNTRSAGEDHPDTILVIEDDPALLRLIQKNLQRIDFQTAGASTGAEAIARIIDQPPLLLLLDYRLPDMTGRQLINTLAERQRLTPFIIATGHGDETVAVEMMKLGARDYLVKDAGFLDLLPSVVKRVVDQLLTERRLAQAERELQKSEQKYRNLFEQASDSIFIIDPVTRRILDGNENAARRLGYTRAELLQLQVDAISSPAVVARNASIAQELLASGHIIFEHVHRRKDGSQIPVEVSSRVIDLDGRMVIQSQVRDITERKQAEKKLETRIQQQAVVAELGQRALTGIDLTTLMNEAVARVAEILEVEYCKILELLPDGDRLLLQAGVGWQDGLVGHVTVPAKTDSQAGYTLHLGKPVIVEDLRTESRFKGPQLLFDHHIISGISVIIAGSKPDRPFGILGVHTTRRQAFAEDNVHFVQAVANVLATAIQRSRTEQEIRHRNRELTLLNQIIAATSGDLEPEVILKTGCRELAIGFDIPYVVASLLNEKKTESIIVAECQPEGVTSLLNEIIPVKDNPLFQYLLTQKSPLVVDDADNDPQLHSLQSRLQPRKIASLLLVPLIIGKEVLGGLELGSSRRCAFSYEDVSLAWSVADQIAGALARSRLTQTQRRLSTVIEQTADSVIVTDTGGIIVYVNPAFERITGYSRADVIGQNPRILKSGKHDSAFYEQMWATINSGSVWRGRISNVKKDGTVFTEEAAISPVRDESGEITNYVAVKRDVTRELELEQHYHQAQKMEAVGRLTGGIAHDFNNLLTAINGFVELMQLRLPPDSPFQEMVGSIHRAGQRAANLIRQLMAFSRRQVIEPQILDLNSVVADLSKMLLPVIGEDIILNLDLGPDLWPIKADLSQLEQVIVNLVVNARDAMPGGGELTIGTSNVVLTEQDIASDPTAEAGDHVLLTVRDTGVGMSEAVKPYIFEPFFTTKEKGKGTGLGLATTYGIVKQNKGSIWVDSEEGQGTTFKIYWPRVTEAVKASFPPAQLDQLPSGHETILLVEDETSVRVIIANILREQGYTVLDASNGEEALALAREHCGQIQLLLTDVVMPQMSGRELAEELKTICPGVKVLYTSGYLDETLAERGVSNLSLAFIQKPFMPIRLMRKVREILDS
jgi:PAS domain S-box-containing protein